VADVPDEWSDPGRVVEYLSREIPHRDVVSRVSASSSTGCARRASRRWTATSSGWSSRSFSPDGTSESDVPEDILQRLRHRAHKACFIASSVTCETRVEPAASATNQPPAEDRD
jgi:hypothetical protein